MWIGNNFVKQFPILATLSQDEIRRLAFRTEFYTASRNSVIYNQGSKSDYIYFLIEGTVKLCVHTDDGRELIKDIVTTPSMFGELCLGGEVSRPENAVVMSKDAKYYTIHVDQFRELMFNNPMLCFNVLQLVGDRLIHTETRLESMVLKDAKTRVIDFLKGLLTKQGRKVGFEMLIKHSFTQQDIANITGTSRQTVTSVLNELKKSKSIQFNRNTILVRDMARL